MERRDFVKALPVLPVLTGAALTQDASAQEVAAQGASGQTAQAGGASSAAKATGKGAAAGGYGKKDLQEFAGMGHSDMGATDADGNHKPGFSDRSSKPKGDPKALYQMPLTQEEQDIMDGKKGPELAKVMKIVVAHGNAFNAERLVDLGGAPHSSLFTGQD